MPLLLKAVFDGKVFKPIGPVDLKPDAEVELAVTTLNEQKRPAKGKSLLRAMAEMNLKGPPDWSEHFKDYLDGERHLTP